MQMKPLMSIVLRLRELSSLAKWQHMADGSTSKSPIVTRFPLTARYSALRDLASPLLGLRVSQIGLRVSQMPKRRNGQLFKLDKGRGRNAAVGQVTQFR